MGRTTDRALRLARVHIWPWAGALAAVALTGTALTGTALVGPAEAGHPNGAAASARSAPSGAPDRAATPAVPGGGAHAATRRALDAAVRAGVPGVIAESRGPAGRWTATAGVGDRTTGRARGPQDRFRIGSLTKTFVATVLLQLEAERRIRLDDTVDRWLPGLVRGHGNDGRAVTVRQLLNHTSGLHDATTDPGFRRQVFGDGFFANRYRTWRPEELVALALRRRPVFAPGTGWGYSNTNFTLAGMIVEKVTGRPYGEEIERRLLRPLRLHGTSVPGTGPLMPRPAGRAYSTLSGDPAAPVHDVTELDPTLAGAAGSMISTTADLNRFYRALLTGSLLPPRQNEEMRTTVAAGPGAGYGLGLERFTLSCGAIVWGHDGSIHGSTSEAVTTADGRHSLALNLNQDRAGDPGQIVEAEFCG